MTRIKFVRDQFAAASSDWNWRGPSLAPSAKPPRNGVRRKESGAQGSAPDRSCILPVELGADLADARIARLGNDSEVPRVVDVPGRIYELRVVEDVEKLET